MMLCSIREEIPKNQQKRPVALMIPVNLRNYFPSQSMTNFFGWIEVGYIFSDETTFEDVLLSVKKQFEEELVKEKIAMHMSGYVRIEKNPFVRAVPLEIKKYFLMIGANLGSRSITAVYLISALFVCRRSTKIYSAFWDFCKYQFFADVFLFLWG